MKHLIIQSLPVPPPVTSNLLHRNIFLKILTLEPPQPAFLSQCERPNFTPILNKPITVPYI